MFNPVGSIRPWPAVTVKQIWEIGTDSRCAKISGEVTNHDEWWPNKKTWFMIIVFIESDPNTRFSLFDENKTVIILNIKYYKEISKNLHVKNIFKLLSEYDLFFSSKTARIS